MTPVTQRAWICTRKGVPSRVLQCRTDLAVPKPTPERPILIKVHAAALSSAMYMMMAVLPSFLTGLPRILESDFAGVIEAGSDLSGTQYRVGDAVYGMLGQIKDTKDRPGEPKQGALAEYITVSPKWIAPKPDRITFEEAAALPSSAGTGYGFVHFKNKVKAGQRILVNGGSSSIGLALIAFAKLQGAYVVATCSPDSKELMGQSGADELVDYRRKDFFSHLGKVYSPPEMRFDFVADIAGVNGLYAVSNTFMKPDGKYEVLGSLVGSLSETAWLVLELAFIWARPVWLGGVRTKWRLMSNGVDGCWKSLPGMNAIIDKAIESVLPFDDVVKGYERVGSKRVKGKIAIRVAPS